MANGTSADKPEFPGAEILSAALQVHTTVVHRHIATVNQVWSEVSSQNASLSSWTSGFSKLLKTWTDNSQELWNFYSGKLLAPAAVGCPELVFMLDKNAQASGVFQCVAVPAALDCSTITATALVSALGVPLDAGSHVTWLADSVGVLKVAISDLGGVPPASKTGTYTAVIYDASMAPVRVLASVRLTFLA
jgi:hypothetical protein